MSDRLSGTDDRYQDQAAEGYFARLASARYMLLTTIELDGTFVSAAVHGVVDGDRAYFRILSRPGIVKRLELTGRGAVRGGRGVFICCGHVVTPWWPGRGW
jgi:hypothetical protein